MTFSVLVTLSPKEDITHLKKTMGSNGHMSQKLWPKYYGIMKG